MSKTHAGVRSPLSLDLLGGDRQPLLNPTCGKYYRTVVSVSRFLGVIHILEYSKHRENSHVITITTPIAIILPTFTPLECSELGVPRATKTMTFGRDRITVAM